MFLHVLLYLQQLRSYFSLLFVLSLVLSAPQTPGVLAVTRSVPQCFCLSDEG